MYAKFLDILNFIYSLMQQTTITWTQQCFHHTDTDPRNLEVLDYSAKLTSEYIRGMFITNNFPMIDNDRFTADIINPCMLSS